jgi:hypothetical protein
MKRLFQWFALPFALCAISVPTLAQWKYSSFPDPDTGLPLRLASSESIAWKGTLLVRMAPEGNVNVAFGVPATIICSSPCKVRARLDGSDDGQRDARYPGIRRNMLYFSPDALPFAKIRKASKLEVEVETKEFGWRVLNFDVRGFNIDRLNAGS